MGHYFELDFCCWYLHIISHVFRFGTCTTLRCFLYVCVISIDCQCYNMYLFFIVIFNNIQLRNCVVCLGFLPCIVILRCIECLVYVNRQGYPECHTSHTLQNGKESRYYKDKSCATQVSQTINTKLEFLWFPLYTGISQDSDYALSPLRIHLIVLIQARCCNEVQ